jgi:hypothetical protein
MKKSIVFLFIILIIGFTVTSCVKEVVTYCIYCGQASLKEESKYNPETGRTEIYYKCTNSKCGKIFGAGQF